MGRPKGAKNRRTLLREAELKIVDRGEFLDRLVVLEEGMRHFYIRAMQLKAVGGKPDEVDANLSKAVGIAEKIAPYRHHKLAAIKLNKDPVEPPFRKGASMDELRAKMQRHLEILAPVLDLEALLAPSDGIANREVQEGCSLGTGSTLSAPVSSSVSASPSANAPRRHLVPSRLTAAPRR